MSNLFTRIISAFVLIPALIALVFFSPFWLFLLVVCFISFLCGFELATFSFSEVFRPFRYLVSILCALCSACVGLFFVFPISPLISLFSLPFISFLFFIFSKFNPKDSVPSLNTTLSSSFYIGSCLGFLPLIFFDKTNGRYLIFSLLLATFVADTFAYAFGKTLGRHKLSTLISPNKTIEGSFGSFLGSLISIICCNFFFLKISWFEVFSLSIVLNIGCQLGDLFESFLKRGFGVKDSGRIIPGHGGIFDRVDALLISAPLFFFFFSLR